MKWQLEIDDKDYNNHVEVGLGHACKSGTDYVTSIRIMKDDIKHNPANVVKRLLEVVAHAKKVRGENP